jgi:hypothetical protein
MPQTCLPKSELPPVRRIVYPPHFENRDTKLFVILRAWPHIRLVYAETYGMYDLRVPSQSYMRSAGHLGWAFPAGLGAKAACPQRPIVVFTGDAGFWYHMASPEFQETV